ncbi:MAG: phosphatidate cytidylyltransferase [Clostridium sp.]|nr:phosphatidate cytidylyltransferase [Clostridium sp.]
MNSRYIGALSLIPILAMFALGGWFLRITVFLLALRSMYEIFHIIKQKGHQPISWLGYGFILALYVMVFFVENPISHLGMFLMLFTAIIFVVVVFDENKTIVDGGLTLSLSVYTGVFFSFLVLLLNLENGLYFVYSVFIISWLCDTMAYYSGRLFGKHKLIERVSPKKTVEGAIGGLIGADLGALALGLLIKDITMIVPRHFLVMGFFGAAFGQVGDLFASSVKRYTGEKDYPKLIPGHGGILDRFDSILFVSFFVYGYVTYIL